MDTTIIQVDCRKFWLRLRVLLFLRIRLPQNRGSPEILTEQRDRLECPLPP